MKILVVSLLRLGDSMMAAPMLQGLRAKHKDAQIDLLVNSEYVYLKNILPMVNDVIGFERKTIQDGLVLSEQPILLSLDLLKEKIQELNLKNYDLVINITQNKVSGIICDLINSKEKQGLVLQTDLPTQFGSQWFRFLNDITASGARNVFHYTDAFAKGADVVCESAKYPMTEAGKAEYQKWANENNVVEHNSLTIPRIVLQVTTSDEKKVFTTRLVLETLQSLRATLGKIEAVFLCAPNEVDTVSAMIKSIAHLDITTYLCPLSIEAAVILLNQSDILLTADTSIKHLAVGTPIAILEVALGSSDPRRTGAYSDNAIIVQSREHCVPCAHSQGCHRTERFCESSVSGFLLSALLKAKLQNDKQAILSLADEYSDEVEIFQPRWAPQKYWYLESLRKAEFPQQVDDWFDLACWRFFLDREHLQSLAPYGHEGLKIVQQMKSCLQANSDYVLKLTLEQLEKKSEEFHQQIYGIQTFFSKQIIKNFSWTEDKEALNELVVRLRTLEQELDIGDSLSSRVIHISSRPSQSVRALQSLLNDIGNHQQIKMKMIRTVKSQIGEQNG